MLSTNKVGMASLAGQTLTRGESLAGLRDYGMATCRDHRHSKFNMAIIYIDDHRHSKKKK